MIRRHQVKMKSSSKEATKEKNDISTNTIAEPVKPKDIGFCLDIDKDNKFKLSLSVDLTRINRAFALGLTEELKNAIWHKALELKNEQTKTNSIISKISFKNFLASKKK